MPERFGESAGIQIEARREAAQRRSGLFARRLDIGFLPVNGALLPHGRMSRHSVRFNNRSAISKGPVYLCSDS